MLHRLLAIFLCIFVCLFGIYLVYSPRDTDNKQSPVMPTSMPDFQLVQPLFVPWNPHGVNLNGSEASIRDLFDEDLNPVDDAIVETFVENGMPYVNITTPSNGIFTFYIDPPHRHQRNVNQPLRWEDLFPNANLTTSLDGLPPRDNNFPDFDDLMASIFQLPHPNSPRSPPNRRNRCPNYYFIEKHHCRWCRNETDTLNFSRARNARGPRYYTYYNHVIVGIIYYHELPGGICENEVPLPVYECNMIDESCRRTGKQCFLRHKYQDGHLLLIGRVHCLQYG